MDANISVHNRSKHNGYNYWNDVLLGRYESDKVLEQEEHPKELFGQQVAVLVSISPLRFRCSKQWIQENICYIDSFLVNPAPYCNSFLSFFFFCGVMEALGFIFMCTLKLTVVLYLKKFLVNHFCSKWQWLNRSQFNLILVSGAVAPIWFVRLATTKICSSDLLVYFICLSFGEQSY